jgi:hypothetical protein
VSTKPPTGNGDAYDGQTMLWDAINRYVVACGGDPSGAVYGNVPRQKAVAAIESIVHDLRSAAPARGRR